jgi:hypothetical protein
MSAPQWAEAFATGDPDKIGQAIYEAMNAGVQATHAGIQPFPAWSSDSLGVVVADDMEKSIYIAAGQYLNDRGVLRVNGQ